MPWGPSGPEMACAQGTYPVDVTRNVVIPLPDRPPPRRAVGCAGAEIRSRAPYGAGVLDGSGEAPSAPSSASSSVTTGSGGVIDLTMVLTGCGFPGSPVGIAQM